MLGTEQRNPNTMHLDKMSTAEMLAAMQNENKNAVASVGAATPQIQQVVDAIYPKMKEGGRLFYIGCGTSGRLGVLDASELPPTFGVESGVAVGIIAGGERSLRFASEDAEDRYERGSEDIKAHNLTEKDSVIGISAAGGAAYVISALEYANSLGCVTAAMVCNPNTKLSEVAKYTIVTDTGAEVIAGSTRMKAGTAQKLVLNMISTSLMVKLGYVYENLMINLRPTNIKLRQRMTQIVCDILHCSAEEAVKRLDENDWVIRKAIENK